MGVLRVPVADGVALHVVEDEGTGPAFLLVHGLASNLRLWDGVRSSLAARGARVVAVDLRGHGRSDKPDDADGYSVAAVAADLAEVMRSLGLEGAVVAGQSWGGNVVLELAAVSPELVGALVLVDGGWIDLSHFSTWEEVVDAMAPPLLAGRTFAEAEAWTRGRHPGWPESGIEGALACFDVREDGTIAPCLTYERHLHVLHGLWQHAPSARYPLVRVPVVLVPCDDGSARVERTRASVDAAAAALAAGVVRWFSADHDVHAQKPDEIADVLWEAAAAAASPSS